MKITCSKIAAASNSKNEFNKYYQFVDDTEMLSMYGDEVQDDNGNIYYPCEDVPGYSITHVAFMVARPEYYDDLSNMGIGEAEWVAEGGEEFAAYAVNDRVYPLSIEEVEEAAGESVAHTSSVSFDFTHEDDYDYNDLQDTVYTALTEAGVTPIGFDTREVDYSPYAGYGDVTVSQCGVDFEWYDDYDSNSLEDAIEDALSVYGYEVIGISFESLED